MGVAVGEAAAEPVADRQGDQHDADRVRPDDGRGAEVRGEQADRGDLGAERSRPDDEDEQRKRHASESRPIPTVTIARVAFVAPVPVDHATLAAEDRAHLWHPFTQQRGWAGEEPLIVERADGTDLIDTDGRRYIDGVSSLWCNVHGHRHPRIDRAVRDAARPRGALHDARPLAPARRSSWRGASWTSRPPG